MLTATAAAAEMIIMPATKTLKSLKSEAKAVGLTYKKQKYKGCMAKHKYNCNTCKKDCLKTPANVYQGKGCMTCSGKKKKTYEDYLKITDANDWVLISTRTEVENGNVIVPVEWKCKVCGEPWYASFNSVTRTKPTGCPTCSGKKKKTYEDYRKVADANDWALISTQKEVENGNVSIPIEWKCKVCGHSWYASYDNVTGAKPRGCPVCGRLKAAKTQNNSQTLTHWKTGGELICVASYEINTVLWLNEQKINFLWQPETFETDIRTKTGKPSTYRPDLYLVDEDLWVEIKGYMRKDAKEKWDWFQATHPNSELWDKQKLTQLGILLR